MNLKSAAVLVLALLSVTSACHADEPAAPIQAPTAGREVTLTTQSGETLILVPYVLVSARSREQLQDAVGEHIALGYLPYGPPQRWDRFGYGDITERSAYVQPMLRHEVFEEYPCLPR